jgi:dTMP kinase
MFIVFEGPEGSGKSTQVKLTTNYLYEQGFNVLQVREPGSTEVGEQIRKILLSVDICPMTELLLFQSSRAQLIHEKIIPHLQSGGIVICDRFTLSTFVYQSIGREINSFIVNMANELGTRFNTDVSCKPDLEIVIDVPLEVTKQRLAGRNQLDRFETSGDKFHSKIRHGFIEEVEMSGDNTNIVLIDGTKKVDEVFDEVLIHINKILGK